jgi:hypothetical protein
MTVSTRLALLAALTLLAGCATQPSSEMPTAGAAPASATAAKPAVEEADDPPMERPEASAQCWMKYDRSGGSLEAKAKLVDKCITEKMKGKP